MMKCHLYCRSHWETRKNWVPICGTPGGQKLLHWWPVYSRKLDKAAHTGPINTTLTTNGTRIPKYPSLAPLPTNPVFICRYLFMVNKHYY